MIIVLIDCEKNFLQVTRPNQQNFSDVSESKTSFSCYIFRQFVCCHVHALKILHDYNKVVVRYNNYKNLYTRKLTWFCLEILLVA